MARNAILWKFIPPGQVDESILVGSMHLNTSDAYNHLDLIQFYMQRHSAIAFEIDMQEGIRDHTDFMIPGGKSLEDFLTGPQRGKIRRLLHRYFNFPYEIIIRLYPMFSMTVLTQALLNQGSRPFLDEFLWNEAQREEKQVIGLEDVDEHYDVLKGIPLRYQVKAFKDFIFNLSKVRREYKKLSDLYAQQRIHAIYRSSRRSLGMIKERMLYSRNEIMVKSIVEFNHMNGALMAIVGAAHLSGKRGILHHLRKLNYKIEPVKEGEILIDNFN